MYCVYCKSRTVNGTCPECKIFYSKTKTFSLTTEWKKRNFYNCLHCSGDLVLANKIPGEVRGICKRCMKPFRIDYDETKAVIFV